MEPIPIAHLFVIRALAGLVVFVAFLFIGVDVEEVAITEQELNVPEETKNMVDHEEAVKLLHALADAEEHFVPDPTVDVDLPCDGRSEIKIEVSREPRSVHYVYAFIIIASVSLLRNYLNGRTWGASSPEVASVKLTDVTKEQDEKIHSLPKDTLVRRIRTSIVQIVQSVLCWAKRRRLSSTEEGDSSKSPCLDPLKSIDINDSSFLCFTCGRNREKENCIQCNTCDTDTEEKSVLVCAMCAIVKHKDHDYEVASFPSRAVKEKALAAENTLKLDIEKELESLMEAFSTEIDEKIGSNGMFEALKRTVASMEAKTKKVIEDPNVTSIDLEEERTQLKELDVKARSEQKAIEGWKETVLAAIRA